MVNTCGEEDHECHALYGYNRAIVDAELFLVKARDNLERIEAAARAEEQEQETRDAEAQVADGRREIAKNLEKINAKELEM